MGTAWQAFSRSPFSTVHSLKRTSFPSSLSVCFLLRASILPHKRTALGTAGTCRPLLAALGLSSSLCHRSELG